jgi:hypothetical protein
VPSPLTSPLTSPRQATPREFKPPLGRSLTPPSISPSRQGGGPMQGSARTSPVHGGRLVGDLPGTPPTNPRPFQEPSGTPPVFKRPLSGPLSGATPNNNVRPGPPNLRAQQPSKCLLYCCAFIYVQQICMLIGLYFLGLHSPTHGSAPLGINSTSPGTGASALGTTSPTAYFSSAFYTQLL